ncbi:hypothetical protein JW964_23890 [candidate division KSB1 bacterium]|nr:hypothetical protein [candidate division KSB1 bacterium]
MKRMISLLILALLAFNFGGCEQTPVTPGNKLEVEPALQKLAPFGFNANRLVSTGSEIQEITNISAYLEEGELEGLPGMKPLKKKVLTLSDQAQYQGYKVRGLRKALSDSLYFYEDDQVKGIRKALFYNSETGKARYYEVKYKFAAFQSMIYDSSTAIVNLNFTLNDTLDDVIETLFQVQRFKESFFIQKIVNDVKITDYKGREVTGVEATKNAYYQSDRHLIRLTQFVDLNPDKSGHLQEDFEFKDGKSSSRSVTFRPDNTGEFAQKLRDGTMITGKFNSVEDDGVGYYEETTDLPAGRYIDKIEKSAHLSVTMPDSISTTNLVERIYYNSGKVTTDSASFISQSQFGVKNTTIYYAKHNGEHGNLHVIENAAGSTLDGNWTTVENNYILIKAEYYLDESGHINLKAYTSETAYKNGEAPFFVADYYFAPDGSGNGTLSYNGEIYDLDFNESGEGEIRADGQSSQIHLFQ